jgi:dTDP-4-amino-4,6-dideoxygalactose transaminase
MDKIMEIAKKHNLVVIEDAAQSMGAKYKGKIAGSFGLAGSFSLYPFKILGCLGDGGIITTDSDELAGKIRLLRDHGQKTKTEIVCFGWNSRLDNVQAAVLNIKLKYLNGYIDRRREIASLYTEGIKGIKGVNIPPAPEAGSNHFDVFQNYVLRAERRNELVSFLREKGVETLIKDPIPNHWQKGLGLSGFKLPITERLADEIVSLPMYPELDEEQIQYVISCVKEFYSK